MILTPFQKTNLTIVFRVATQLGVNPVIAVATCLQESLAFAHMIGDNGTSFGLFQLHTGGELGKLSMQDAFDPEKNARVALAEFKRLQDKYPSLPMLAAAAQRPQDRLDYQQRIKNWMPTAQKIVAQIEAQEYGK